MARPLPVLRFVSQRRGVRLETQKAASDPTLREIATSVRADLLAKEPRGLTRSTALARWGSAERTSGPVTTPHRDGSQVDGTLKKLLPLREAVSVWACAVHAVLDETRRMASGGDPDVELLERLNEAVEHARGRCEVVSMALSADPNLSEVLRIARLHGLQWGALGT